MPKQNFFPLLCVRKTPIIIIIKNHVETNRKTFRQTNELYVCKQAYMYVPSPIMKVGKKVFFFFLRIVTRASQKISHPRRCCCYCTQKLISLFRYFDGRMGKNEKTFVSWTNRIWYGFFDFYYTGRLRNINQNEPEAD